MGMVIPWERNGKKPRRLIPYAVLDSLEEIKWSAFNDVEQSNQMIQSDLMCTYVNWAVMY